MKPKRILIINADDLGFTQGINRAIFRCHRQGVLSSATLMAKGTAFLDAVQRTKSHPDMGIGVHLVLTGLEPAASANEVPDLVDDGGRLPRSPGKLLASLTAGRITEASIQKELHAQLSMVVDCGIRPTHLDSHKHVHLIPRVLSIVTELAKKFGIRWIRNPFDKSPLNPLLKHLQREQRKILVCQHIKASMVQVVRRSFFTQIRKAGLYTPDNFFGVSLTGLWNQQAAHCIFHRLPPGVTEWMLHPGDCDPDLLNSNTRLLEEREKERDLLLSSDFKRMLEKGVQIKHFGEVPLC